jgi:hypothetical protein
METLLEIEEHPLPEDTWGEAPQSTIFQVDDQAPTSIEHTTAAP